MNKAIRILLSRFLYVSKFQSKGHRSQTVNLVKQIIWWWCKSFAIFVLLIQIVKKKHSNDLKPWFWHLFFVVEIKEIVLQMQRKGADSGRLLSLIQVINWRSFKKKAVSRAKRWFWSFHWVAVWEFCSNSVDIWLFIKSKLWFNDNVGAFFIILCVRWSQSAPGVMAVSIRCGLTKKKVILFAVLFKFSVVLNRIACSARRIGRRWLRCAHVIIIVLRLSSRLITPIAVFSPLTVVVKPNCTRSCGCVILNWAEIWFLLPKRTVQGV